MASDTASWPDFSDLEWLSFFHLLWRCLGPFGATIRRDIPTSVDFVDVRLYSLALRRNLAYILQIFSFPCRYRCDAKLYHKEILTKYVACEINVACTHFPFSHNRRREPSKSTERGRFLPFGFRLSPVWPQTFSFGSIWEVLEF